MALSTGTKPVRNVFVTGANGYIGLAVSRAFVRAGWNVYGLVRKPEAAAELTLSEVTPVVGTFDNLSYLDALFRQANTFHTIVSCTEQVPGYAAHYNQVIELIKNVAHESNENGIRPLVLWSSGCKDYGTTLCHGDARLAPHTEESPLHAPDVLRERTENCPRVFDHKHLFDAVVVRPTCVFGYSSSYYGPMLDYASGERAKGLDTLTIPGNPNSIMHATHVDDCAEAYLSLAEFSNTAALANNFFNISGHRYETLSEIADALAVEYGFENGARFVPIGEAEPSFPEALHFVFSFSQWVGSEKIRKRTGWKDRRLLFSQNLHVHRLAYERFKQGGHSNILSVQKRMGGNFQ